MNSKELIEMLKDKIESNGDNEHKVDCLLDVLPCSMEFDFSNREVLSQFFEPEDSKEKKYFIDQMKKLLNDLHTDFLSFLKLAYEQVDVYIKQCIPKDNFKYKKLENRGKMYNRIHYLIEKYDIKLDSSELEIIDYVDSVLRIKRNEFTHEELAICNENDAEMVLNCGFVSVFVEDFRLKLIEIENEIVDILKNFLDIIDNKIISEIICK